jgi:hypothetical protein
MSKDILFGNVMATPLSPVATGDTRADEAILRLQAWPMSPYTPISRPGEREYQSVVAMAEAVGPAKLLALLDDAAVATGVSHWSDEHLQSLKTGDRKKFKAHYEAVLAALAVRKAYLHWLIGAVCNTPEGLPRALTIVASGTLAARIVAADTLWHNLAEPEDRRRFADALDLREWEGEDHELERVYRLGVAALAEVDAAETYDRYASLLVASEYGTPEYNRCDALLYGLIAWADRRAALLGEQRFDALDARWVPASLPLLRSELDNLIVMLLERMPADPSTLEPLCEFLPEPHDTDGYWHQGAVKLLARVADTRALPWLIGALHASWMNWPAAFEGFRRAGDPAMAHVIREWLSKNGAPDRNKAGKAVIAELEKHGAAPKPEAPSFEPKPEPERERPVLVYKKTRAFKAPKLDSLAAVTKVYGKAFAHADLDDYFDRLAQRAVWLIPKRVDERKLELGGTKLGGHPELPAKTPWPRVAGEPLTFVAQIALREVAPHLPKGVLPASGVLSFFVSNDPDGAAGYLEHARVLYTPARAKLVRHEVPDDFVDIIYQAATVKLHPTLSLPSPSNRHVTKLLKGDKLRRYEEQVFDSAPALPQLLGFRSHGYDAEEPATSQLLLQLTGDDQTEMQFGDVEYLAFFIHEKKLAEREFGKVWPRVGD